MPRSHDDHSHYDHDYDYDYDDEGSLQIDELLPINDQSAPIEISIENQAGDIRVRGTDRNDIWVKAEKHGNRSSPAYQAARFRIQSANNVVTIAPILPGGHGGGPNVSVDVDLDIGEIMRGVFGGRDRGDIDERAVDHAVREAERGAEHAARQAERATRQAERSLRRGRRGRGFGISWNSNDVFYEIEIEVPRQLEYRLRINTMSGEVDVADLTGALDLTSASGDMAVGQVTGDLRFNTASGSLDLKQGLGQLTANTASGDLLIEGSAFNAAAIHAASGDVQVDAALTGTGPYAIDSVSGDVGLALTALNPATGADRALTVTFRSMSGDASLGGEFTTRGGRQWTTPGSEVGPTVAVKTVSGDLTGRVGASNRATTLGRQATERMTPTSAATPGPAVMPPAPPAPPTPPVPPITPPFAPVADRPAVPVMPATPAAMADEVGEAGRVVHARGTIAPEQGETGNAARLALLEAVERGEMDIEEALRRLEERAETEDSPSEH